MEKWHRLLELGLATYEKGERKKRGGRGQWSGYRL